MRTFTNRRLLAGFTRRRDVIERPARRKPARAMEGRFQFRETFWRRNTQKFCGVFQGMCESFRKTPRMFDRDETAFAANLAPQRRQLFPFFALWQTRPDVNAMPMEICVATAELIAPRVPVLFAGDTKTPLRRSPEAANIRVEFLHKIPASALRRFS